ncbi:LOW QUALITY PROTEIN: interleukin-6 [Corvus moneduloides]|uniref:LOW QUALITY PROTEIN: interleukin-6 n=1 Tax=Corvus moneduloides TaxID=1196302 RepID=UPI0013630E53|nr:LOW QUALITY PROTEIN: interleukin-6 [Corvus moneduloides]
MKFPRDCGCDRARAGRRRPPALRAALLPPPLLLLLLVPRAAAAPLPSADSSGEAELDEAAARRAPLPQSLLLARLLHARAAQLQDEVGTAHRGLAHAHTPGPAAAASCQGATKPLRVSPQVCEKFTICPNSMEMLLHNNLSLPKVTKEDGCLLAGFDEDKCLRTISSGLYTFQTYLKYVQETFISENQNVESLSYSTERLARTIRQMVINPEEVIIPDAATQESLHTKLKSIRAWTEKITIQLILRDFTSFMEKTVRAVRYLQNTRSFRA